MRTRALPASESSHDVDVRVFRNLSNRLAYHLQFFTPIGLGSYLRTAGRSFDIAHLHACHNLPGAIAATALARASVPYVVSPNGTALPIERRILAKRDLRQLRGGSVLTGAAQVLAVTDVERQQLRPWEYHYAHRVVPNPVEDASAAEAAAVRFRSAHHLGDRRLVLFLGKLTPRKGVDDLIRAYGLQVARHGPRHCR